MKTYNISKRMSKQARLAILNAINEHDLLCSYVLKPEKNGASRRIAEKIVNERHPSFRLILSDFRCCAVYVAYAQTSINVYYSMRVVIEKNGVMLESKDVGFLKELIESKVRDLSDHENAKYNSRVIQNILKS